MTRGGEGKVIIDRALLRWPERTSIWREEPARLVVHVVGGDITGEIGIQIASRLANPGDVLIEEEGRVWHISPGGSIILSFGNTVWHSCTRVGVGARVPAFVRFTVPGAYVITVSAGKIRHVWGRAVLVPDDELTLVTYVTAGTFPPPFPPYPTRPPVRTTPVVTPTVTPRGRVATPRTGTHIAKEVAKSVLPVAAVGGLVIEVVRLVTRK